jgi:stage II sporulation protein D
VIKWQRKIMRTFRVNATIFGAWIKRCCILILVLLPLFSAACGKHKVKAKSPTPVSSIPAKQIEPSKAPIPQAKPEPKNHTGEPQAIVLEPASSEPAAPSAGNASGPPIRIGLTTSARELRISSPGEFYVLEKKPEARKQLIQGEIQAQVERESNESSIVYRVQVASYAKRQMAEDLQKEIADSFDAPVTIHEDSDLGVFQVRVGEFSTREKAQSFLGTATKKFHDAFIVRETSSAGSGKTILALRGKQSFFQVSKTGFLFIPASGADFLSFDGKPYRGLLNISLNQNGRITVVNQLGTEEYLLGVVPAEMSPYDYPEFAALAAQSIAARTYALKNKGRFDSEGYDLTADTQTQVYKGVAAERDASSRAVRKTSGIAVYYQGELIQAMYMSTCGGRTEDYANVYGTDPIPYLKSVFCSIESGDEIGQTILEGNHTLDQSITADDGSLANRNLEFAEILGVVDSDLSPEFLAAPANQKECASWIETSRKLIKKARVAETSAEKGDLTTRAGFLQFAAESVFGVDEIKRKISSRDAGYYIGNLADGDSVPERARYALAYLMQNNLWRPYPDNTIQPKTPIRRGDALSLLLRWIEFQQPEILRKGVFVSTGKNAKNAALNIKWGNRTQEFPLSKNPLLFRLDTDRTIPVARLKIIGNEKLRFHVDQNGSIDFLEIELNPTGASSDRYSPAATWDTTLTRSVIAEKLRSLTAQAGEFKDLKPARLGNSGRAVQIEVTGSRGYVVVNGYKVKSALGLKDTLFTITRDINPDGSVASFTFHGRGNGHGIGLCQIGAFGMARAGYSYEEILKAYYTGVEIRKAY